MSNHVISRNVCGIMVATVLLCTASPLWAGPLSAQITEARNDRGVVRCGLFKEATTWRNEDQAWRTVDASLQSGQAQCDFGTVPPGDYAIAVFHAEHNEAKVSYGFLGKPKQGVGFSNNPSITFGAPDFAQAVFRVDTHALVLPIHLTY